MAAAMDRRGSQPAMTSLPLGHGRSKSLGHAMGSVPMSPGGSGSPMMGAEVEWADIQARYIYPIFPFADRKLKANLLGHSASGGSSVVRWIERDRSSSRIIG